MIAFSITCRPPDFSPNHSNPINGIETSGCSESKRGKNRVHSMHWSGFAVDCVRVASIRNVSTTNWLFASGQRGGATGFYGMYPWCLQSVLRHWPPDHDEHGPDPVE